MPDFPFVSVIIPLRNEEAFIQKGLHAIFSQDYPANSIEVLLADGMSTDRTREIIAEYQKDHPHLQLIDNPGRIVPTGMNLALRQSKGEIIIRVDGHCIIAPDYVSKCVQYLSNGEYDGVGGPMKSIGETPLSETIAMGMSSPFGVGNSAFRTTTGKTMQVDSVPFPAYTMAIIENAGLYDEELVRNQDDEYNYRIREAGGKILLAEDIHSTYYSRGSLNKLWKQYFQYGYWKVRVLQKHPRQMSPRQFVPPAFVFGLLFAFLLSFVFAWGKWLLAVIVSLYLISNIIASLITSAKRGWKHLPLLPVVYAILHLSYGSGFLIGLVRFANRWGDKIGKVPKWDSSMSDRQTLN